MTQSIYLVKKLLHDCIKQIRTKKTVLKDDTISADTRLQVLDQIEVLRTQKAKLRAKILYLSNDESLNAGDIRRIVRSEINWQLTAYACISISILLAAIMLAVIGIYSFTLEQSNTVSSAVVNLDDHLRALIAQQVATPKTAATDLPYMIPLIVGSIILSITAIIKAGLESPLTAQKTLDLLTQDLQKRYPGLQSVIAQQENGLPPTLKDKEKDVVVADLLPNKDIVPTTDYETSSSINSSTTDIINAVKN